MELKISEDKLNGDQMKIVCGYLKHKGDKAIPQKKDLLQVRYDMVKKRTPYTMKEYLDANGYENDGCICDRLIVQETPPPLPNTANDVAAAIDLHMSAVDAVVPPPQTEESPNDVMVGASEEL